GDRRRLDVPGDDRLFPHDCPSGRVLPSASPRLASVSSVETRAVSPSRAERSVCQGSDAHFTRTGNSHTPEKAASLPSPGAAFSAAREGSLVMRRWKRSNNASASARVLPLRASVIIEAEAVEIEQPAPLKLTSFTRSPCSSTK